MNQQLHWLQIKFLELKKKSKEQKKQKEEEKLWNQIEIEIG